MYAHCSVGMVPQCQHVDPEIFQKVLEMMQVVSCYVYESWLLDKHDILSPIQLFV